MARYPGFVGGTYRGQAPTPATDRCINWYPEIVGGAGAPENQVVLVPTPGLVEFAVLPDGAMRCLFRGGGRTLAVAGGTLYEVDQAGGYTPLGGVARSTRPATIAYNTVQYAIASGGQVYILSGSTLMPVTTGEQVVFSGGYFITFHAGTQQFQISGLYDGTTWYALDFGSAEGAPDNVVSMLADHRELWLFGEESVEPFYNSGNADFPFERIQGGFIETGSGAAYGAAKLDNSTFWMHADARGTGMVWRANGFTPQRISTHSVEWYIQQYAKHGGIADAEGYAYQADGHTFYVLHFPSATSEGFSAGGTVDEVVNGATWAYDCATGLWHERTHWDAVHGKAERHLARCHCVAWNKHLVGSWKDGTIYEQHGDYYDDAGDEIRRVRRAPHLNDELVRMTYHELRLNARVGIGNDADVDPQVVLRWSGDGGLTWSNEYQRSLGAAGEYDTLVRWQHLGQARRRQFEVSTTARVPVTLVDAYLRLDKGRS